MAGEIDTTASKPCKACGVLRPLTGFRKNVRCRSGRVGVCRNCENERARAHVANSAEKKATIRDRVMRHRAALPRQEYLDKRREEKARAAAKRGEAHRSLEQFRQEVRAAADRRRADRKAAADAKRTMKFVERIALRPWSDPALTDAERFALRYKLDPEFNVGQKVRTALRKKRRGWRVDELIRSSIKGESRSRRIERHFGYSVADLRQHLEAGFTSGMDWPRFCAGEIHIDHRRPLSSFDLTDSDQLRAAWQMSNLQPLWAADNLAKGARWEPEAKAV